MAEKIVWKSGYETTWRGDALYGVLDTASREAAISLAEACANAAAEFAPIETGALRRALTSWVTQNGRGRWYVHFGVPEQSGIVYALFQEIGFTHWISGQWIEGKHYMRRAADLYLPQYPHWVRAHLPHGWERLA